MQKTVTIDGVLYAEVASGKRAVGKRAVVVVDRGWIFAGDVHEENGRIRLTRALWVFNWSSVGFDGVIKNPADSNVTLRRLDHDVDIPADAEVFRVPVDDDWGLCDC